MRSEVINGRLLSIYNWLIAPIPLKSLTKIKKWYLRKCGVKIGDGVLLSPGVIIIGGGGTIEIGDGTEIGYGVCIESFRGRIEIGARCEVNYGTLIAANKGSCVRIGNDVHIAHQCSLKGSTHELDIRCEGNSIAGESRFLDIEVGDGSWLCAGCVILPGVRIGRRNVIGAGAVVTKDTPESVLVAGVPAKIKKHYKGTFNLENL